VVRGNERPCARGEEVAGDGDGKRGAFFWIGGRAKLVEKDERFVSGETREAVEVDDVRGKCGEFRFD